MQQISAPITNYVSLILALQTVTLLFL